HAVPGRSRGAGRPRGGAGARPRGRRRQHGRGAPARRAAAHPLPVGAGRRGCRGLAAGAQRAPHGCAHRDRHRCRRGGGPAPARRGRGAVRTRSAARRPGGSLPRTHPRRRRRRNRQPARGRLMNTIAIDADRSAHSSLRIYLLEAKHEFLRMLRTPSFALPVLLFPALFYTLFGLVLNRADGGMAARYLLATYGVFGVMGAGLFGFGVVVASERERGFFTYKRALQMPPGAYLFARMVMAMLFSALISAMLAALAGTLGGVSL